MGQKEAVSRILYTEFVTHDVQSFLVERPDGYEFVPGQATEVSLWKEGWKKEKRPFTFTSSPDDPILQFIIKRYPSHEGVTQKLHSLTVGDRLHLEEAWGTIQHRGPGTFLAAGAGVTPFISILRRLRSKDELKGNRLFFSNKRHQDIILEREFREMFPEKDLHLTLSREERAGYPHGRIDKPLLEERIEDLSQNFYICGPPEFVDAMRSHLEELGAETDSLVFEE